MGANVVLEKKQTDGRRRKKTPPLSSPKRGGMGPSLPYLAMPLPQGRGFRTALPLGEAAQSAGEGICLNPLRSQWLQYLEQDSLNDAG